MEHYAQKYETTFVEARGPEDLGKKVSALEAVGWMFISFQLTAQGEFRYPYLVAALRRELPAPATSPHR